ncbi:porin family protein [Adhaeribacter soli]|uniref:PorT family protein n=1 Tax=Adhaeribacter soli TaxID=2607655 RepID=A0A5N1IM42_9BACT|nr:porin family protein [Adhaeribacter soli]KAA9324977.1 PorT family protein [Adhaeribacter soli]
MKKSLLLILAVFAFTYANAQGFRLGVKGGGNYSSLSGEDQDFAGIYTDDNVYFGDADYKFGYHFGLTSLYEIDDFWGIKIDALYTTKGFQIKDKQADLSSDNMGGTTEFEVKRSLNYISVPILLNINAGGLFFELGPEVAYLTNSNSEVKTKRFKPNGDKLGDSDKTESISAKGDLASFDFGYVAGLGYMSDMGLGIGLRYNGGFKSIYDTKGTEEPNIRNNNITVSLFYMFGGGGNGGGGSTKVKYKTE